MIDVAALDLIRDLPADYRRALYRKAQRRGAHPTIPSDRDLYAAARGGVPEHHGHGVGAWIDAELEERRAASRGRPFLEDLSDLWGPIAANVDPATMRLLDASEDGVHEEAERRAERARERQQARREAQRGAGKQPADQTPDESRERDVAWQRNQLRKQLALADLYFGQAAGLVGRHSPFVSRNSMDRYQRRQKLAREWIEQHGITDGERAVPLAQVVDAAAAAREAEMYALALGMEREGERRGYATMFLTLTLPPDYHPAPHTDGRNWDPDNGPEAQKEELAARWTRIRAACRRRGFMPFGMWVKEPHADGTPHLHAMLWAPADRLDDLEAIARRHFPADGGPAEAACEARRFGAGKAGREGRASAATYMMTYIQKQQQTDRRQVIAFDGRDADQLAERDRYRAWATSLGVRRFGFIGLTPGTRTRWSAIYRAEELPDDPHARAAKTAMNRGEWDAAVRALGGFTDEGPTWRTIYGFRENRYGELERQAVAAVPPTLAARLAAFRRVLRDDEGRFYDGETGEELPFSLPAEGLIELRPVAWTISPLEDLAGLVSVIDSDPRGADPPRPHAADPPAAAAA
jgi:hypothetical protein